MKQCHSWFRPKECVDNLIGIKKVDYTMIDEGSTIIPQIFQEGFLTIQTLRENEEKKKKVYLKYNDILYKGTISEDIKGRITISILSTELKEIIKKSFHRSFERLLEERRGLNVAKKKIILSDDEAEYVEFYRTGEEDVYELKFITRKLQGDDIYKVSNVDGESMINLSKEFKIWLEKNAVTAQKSVSKYCAALKTTSKHFKECLNQDIDIYAIEDIDFIDKIICIYKSEAVLKERDKGRMYTAALGWYKNFLICRRTSKEICHNENTSYCYKDIDYDEEVEHTNLDNKEDIDVIYEYITNQGLTYSKETIYNFYLSLKSKPFTILAGISGTGKSKLVRLFAEAIGADFTLIPVKPDWSDTTELLGYKDLEGEYQVGKFIEIIREARKPENQSTPYIVCLDEMNLARVEYYFSDFLSLIESREEIEGEIITDCFKGPGIEEDYIPENVYIVGTVNMDETTFQFSKKVLDRANTIELSEVDLSFDFDMDYDDELEPMLVHNDALKSEYLLLKDCKEYKELAQRVIEKLIEINDILKPCSLEFAYRVRDEIIFYMVYNEEYELLSEEEAFDFQMLQKILPRISGTSRQIEDLIINLLDFCTDDKLSINEIDENRDEDEINEHAIYERSVKKLLQMLRRCEDGFTSFW